MRRPPPPLISDWLRIYLAERDIAATTAKTYACAIRSFGRFAAIAGVGQNVQSLAERINDFIAAEVGRVGRQTAKCYRTALVALLRAAAEAGLVALPRKIRPVKLPDHEPSGFTDAERAALFEHAFPLERAAIVVAYFAAYRRSDVFRVRWPSNPVPAGQGVRVAVVVSKSGRIAYRYLPPEAVDVCRKVRTSSDDRLVPWPMKMTGWRGAWRRLGKRAGVNTHRRGLQALRRTAATLVAAEYGAAAAIALLGHSPRTGAAVFERYYRVGGLIDDAPPSPPPLKTQ